MKEKYGWLRSQPADADAVAAQVEKLRKSHGGVIPPQVLVDASRNEEAPAHRCFTWDDWAAAEAHRRNEGREVLRNLVIVGLDDEGGTAPPAYYHVVTTNKVGDVIEGYAPASEVAKDAGMRHFAEEEALRQIQGLRRRIGHLKRLQPIWEAVDQVADSIQAQPVT
jgi:hypothetical protein